MAASHQPKAVIIECRAGSAPKLQAINSTLASLRGLPATSYSTFKARFLGCASRGGK